MKAITIAFCGVFILFLCSCHRKFSSPTIAEKKVIAFGEFHQEVNSFSNVTSTEWDFRAGCLSYGSDVFTTAQMDNKQLAGFLKAVEKFGEGEIETIPLVHVKSVSGGKVDSIFYQEIKKQILERLSSIPRLDGIYLSLHGAMGVQGLHDPEADLLQAIRQLVGDKVPIAISFDLHANVTKRQVKLANIIVGYRTNPHRDHKKTGFRTGKLLIETVQGEVNPVMVMNKMRLLKGGGINIDFLPPFRDIFQRMNRMEHQQDVLSVSFFPVQLWLDAPEVGYSTLAITNNNLDLAQELADEIADQAWEVRAVPQPKSFDPETAIKMAREARWERALGTVVFCDVSDAVGAGTPGESTHILKALIENGADMVSYIPLRDREAVLEAWNKQKGDSISLSIGGKLDLIYNKPINFNGRILIKMETYNGKTMVIQHHGIHLVLSEFPMTCFKPSDFTSLGLSLWNADIVVVKNLFPFRLFYLPYNRQTIHVLTPGLSCTDPGQLNYQYLPRPIYPLDPVVSWRSDD